MNEIVADGVELEEDAAVDEMPLELEIAEQRLATQSLDLSIDALVARISQNRLILQPEFQRNYVWSAAKASALAV